MSTCVNCERAIYWHELRQIWVHYVGDSEFCFPNLAHVDAFSHVAVPEP